MKTSEKINQIASEIEEELNKYPVPAPNNSIPQRIKFLAGQLSSHNHYAAEKAYEIATLASDFYSVRKHKKHIGGSDYLWSQMQELLRRIRATAINYEAS